MKYRIEISAEAQAELREAYLWIYGDSPGNAARWRQRILNAIRTLAELPQRCEIAPESESFRQEIRQLLFGKRSGVYRILFTIERDVIYILHIRHASRRILGETPEIDADEDDTNQ
jgi:plasmid stabilization system protein ParE